jgi:hypothetical protein
MMSDTRAAYMEQVSAGTSTEDNPPPRDLPTKVFGWLQERVAEGERVLRADPSYNRSEELIADLMGDQPTGKHRSNPEHSVVLNQTRKAVNTHASLLTDLRPLWEYRTKNDDYQEHAAVFNDLLLTWWLQTFADLELADGVRYAATIGSSDMVFEYDPNFNGGDMRMLARDWRDTIPIRPERSRTIQDWEGVILREAHSAAKVRATYPGKLQTSASRTGLYEGVFTKVRRLIRPEGTVSTLSGLGAKDPRNRYAAQAAQDEFVLYRAFVRDRSINRSGQRVLMGKPGANWAYFVESGKSLYPRGRCIVFTESSPTPLFDGPNPYWHGRWPESRLSLQRWPWLMVGMPLAFDMRNLQKILNITVNDILQVFSQWVNRGSIWQKNAPASEFQRFDPTKKNWKIKVNTMVGTGFQLQDGPQLPPWVFNFLTFLFQKWDELAGVANLNQLLQLRQVPGRETVEKYLEAMTPEIRLEARQVEAFLRDIADMFLYNVVQFYSKEKRRLRLGAAGEVIEDLDYDPETMIPSLSPEDPNYTPELDAALPRDERAQFHLKQFAFYVAPSSILALHAQERKMLYVQQSRQGFIDFWTLGEMLEIPNLGAPPVVLLPKNVTEEEVQQMHANNQLPIDPNTGQIQLPLEPRRPKTITERLIAQAQLGIGQTVSPAGRKATGQQAPEMKQRSSGETFISESG